MFVRRGYRKTICDITGQDDQKKKYSEINK